MQQSRKAALLHLQLKVSVAAVLNGLHADAVRRFDIFLLVVDKEDLGWIGGETLGSAVVDRRFRFSQLVRVGPDAVVEPADPVEFCDEPVGHLVPDVGEDASADPCALQPPGPFHDGKIQSRPEIDVGGDEVGDLRRGEGGLRTFRYPMPVGSPGEGAAVVLVAVSPIFAVEIGFAEAADGQHLLPDNGVGGQGEDLAKIEENCFDWNHRLNGYCRG